MTVIVVIHLPAGSAVGLVEEVPQREIESLIADRWGVQPLQ